jgi:hypothetical protein
MSAPKKKTKPKAAPSKRKAPRDIERDPPSPTARQLGSVRHRVGLANSLMCQAFSKDPIYSDVTTRISRKEFQRAASQYASALIREADNDLDDERRIDRARTANGNEEYAPSWVHVDSIDEERPSRSRRRVIRG